MFITCQMVQKTQDVRNESHPLSVHKTHSEEPKRHDSYCEKGCLGNSAKGFCLKKR